MKGKYKAERDRKLSRMDKIIHTDTHKHVNIHIQVYTQHDNLHVLTPLPPLPQKQQ